MLKLAFTSCFYMNIVAQLLTWPQCLSSCAGGSSVVPASRRSPSKFQCPRLSSSSPLHWDHPISKYQEELIIVKCIHLFFLGTAAEPINQIKYKYLSVTHRIWRNIDAGHTLLHTPQVLILFSYVVIEVVHQVLVAFICPGGRDIPWRFEEKTL